MGSLRSDVDTYPADAHDLESYRQAERDISRMQFPVLVHADNPHERLYVAALDGTNNSMHKDAPENWSVVAKAYNQIILSNPNNIAAGYVEGIGTQSNPVAGLIDGINGYSFNDRVETAYFDFCVQAKAWIREDPQAQIRVAGIGFSRGAEEEAALHRLIHERGIRDPEGADFKRNADGIITDITYAKKPLLREPGQTVQVALLYDPVSTGLEEHNRSLPGSVVARLQLTAEDERRDQFKSTSHVAPGCSDDGRFCNLTVGGSHSDVGNTYAKNGLGARSFNLGVDALNALSDRPFLHKQAVPDDPALNVVHRSDQHMMGVYTTRGFADGERDRHTRLGGAACRAQAVEPCDTAAPADPALTRDLEFRAPTIAPIPVAASSADRDAVLAPANPITFFPRTPSDDYLDAYCVAAQRGDLSACSDLTRQHAQQPHMQQVQEQGRELYQAEQQRQAEELARQERERQAMLQAQQQEQAQQEQAQQQQRVLVRSL